MKIRHVCTVVLAVALLAILALGSAVLTDDAARPPNNSELHVAVVGDQYAAGIGSVSIWPTLMADRTGWSVANFAVPYAGYDAKGLGGVGFASQVERAQAARADVIVIVGGLADYEATDAAISVGVRDILNKVAVAGGTAMIVGPTWYEMPVPTTTRRISDAAQKVASEVGVRFLDALDPPWLTTAQMNSDLSAPSDEGQSIIADRVAKWLEAEAGR